MNSIGETRQCGIIILSTILGFSVAFAEPNTPWQVEPSMAIARDQFTGGVIGQYLYVFGGNGNPGGINLKSTEAFDIENGIWSFRADNEHNDGQGVEELTAAVVNGRLYVFGAYGGIASDGYYGVCNFNEMYDPVGDTWTTLAQKPTGVAAGPAAVYNNEIYIFGGYFNSQNPSQSHDTHGVVECYNPDSDTWRYVTDLPRVTECHAVAVVGSKAYVIGGYSESVSSMVSDVASYDFAMGQWRTEGYTPLPSPLGFTYSGAAPVVHGKIYLIGAVAGDATDNWGVDDVYIYDPVSNTWEEGPNLPEPRDNHLAVSHGERIYIVGGCVDEDSENRALDEVLSLDVSSTSEVSEHVLKIEMGKTYDYRYTEGADHMVNFDAAVQADDSVGSIVMKTPVGSDYTLVLEAEDGERWFNHHVGSLSEADLADFTAGTYTFTVNYTTGGSDTTTVLYALPGGGPIPPVTQQPVLLYPSNGAADVPVLLSFEFQQPADSAWTTSLEWEAMTGSNGGSVEELASDVNSYGPVALNPNTEYRVGLTIGHVIWGTNPDGIPTVVDMDAEERFTFTTGGSVIWPLEVGQIWEYRTVDSRQPGSPWTTESHVLEIVEIDGGEYYHLGQYESKTGTWESGVVYIRSDAQTVYIRDEGVDKEWPLSTMLAEHIDVPYGEFDGYRTTDFHEQGWYNYFVPGVGLVKWRQVEETYTVSTELVDIRKPLWPMHVGKRHNYTRKDTNDPQGWPMHYEFADRASIDSREYFRLQVWNYENDSTTESEGYVRSTDDALYNYNPDGEDYLEFRKAPVGTKWTLQQERDDGLDCEVIEIVAIEPVTTPYGTFSEAYKHRKFRCVDPDNLALGVSPHRYEWIVPGVGQVKTEDYWADYPPAIMELTSIEAGIGAALLHDWNGDGFVSIIGDVPPFVNCVYFQSCPDWPEEQVLAVGDCNGDWIISIIGDVPCFVDCVYFGNCPE